MSLASSASLTLRAARGSSTGTARRHGNRPPSVNSSTVSSPSATAPSRPSASSCGWRSPPTCATSTIGSASASATSASPAASPERGQAQRHWLLSPRKSCPPRGCPPSRQPQANYVPLSPLRGKISPRCTQLPLLPTAVSRPLSGRRERDSTQLTAPRALPPHPTRAPSRRRIPRRESSCPVTPPQSSSSSSRRCPPSVLGLCAHYRTGTHSLASPSRQRRGYLIERRWRRVLYVTRARLVLR